MAQLFRNNAFSNLGASLTNSSTTLTVTSGHGNRFPVVAAPDFCLLTLQDASNNIEIVKVTARTAGSDSMTIERAQEDTTARAWNIGDVVELRLTAGGLAGANVATATKLQTARTITIGNTGKIFDGSANVSWSLAEIGAPATNGTGATGTWGISVSGNATTATKLQTARTINGTSFDGSANITTANWGTARTLTIGNTGKSVNGSANVSWSLDEIGAARFAILADGTDLNTVVAPGFYRLWGTHGNMPPGVIDGQLIVARGGGDTILQIVTGYANGEIYWRQGNPPDVGGGGSWSAWHRFFHSGNLGAATESSAGIVELATAAEAQALASAAVALTPARLADAFKGANQSLNTAGYQKLPGGLIIQWGSAAVYSDGANGGSTNVTFPIAFSAFARVVVSKNGTGNSGAEVVHANLGSSLTGFTVIIDSATGNEGAGTRQVAWIAIGY